MKLLSHEVFDIIELKYAMYPDSVQGQVCSLCTHNDNLRANRDSMAVFSVELRRRTDVHSDVADHPISYNTGGRHALNGSEQFEEIYLMVEFVRLAHLNPGGVD